MKAKPKTKRVIKPMEFNTEPNPKNVQFRLGKDEGFKEAQESIIKSSPYHQLIQEKHRKNFLEKQKDQLQEQLESTKKEILISEEKIRGYKNQIEETIR